MLVISIIQACTHSAKTPPAETAQQVKKDSTSKDTAVKSYFPVSDYIRSDIANAETYYTAFHQYITRGTKTDSSYIQPAAFKKLAEEFTTGELTKEALEKDYHETSFFDQSVGAYTFTYSTTNSSLVVQRVDVLASPGEGYDKIRSIYIEKRGMQNNTPFVKKMYWKAGKSFQVITTLNTVNPVTENIKIVWNQ